MDIYCVKCKAKTPTENVTEKTTKNGRSALTGNCVKCNTKKYRFISKKK